MDHANVANTLLEMQDYHGAIEHARKARALLAGLMTDATNVQVRVDEANLLSHIGRAQLALGQVRDATATLEHNRETLLAIARQNDTLKVQWLLGAAEQTLGAVHSRLAAEAGADRAQRLRHWKQAKAWYESAIPHFSRVTSSIKLDHMDQRLVDEAKEGLARCTSEIAELARS